MVRASGVADACNLADAAARAGDNGNGTLNGTPLVDVGDSFKVGTLTYTNGYWLPFARVGLRIDTVSADPLLNGPVASLGSVRLYEGHIQSAGNPGNTGTADLYGRIGSLIPVRFDNPSPAPTR